MDKYSRTALIIAVYGAAAEHVIVFCDRPNLLKEHRVNAQCNNIFFGSLSRILWVKQRHNLMQDSPLGALELNFKLEFEESPQFVHRQVAFIATIESMEDRLQVLKLAHFFTFHFLLGSLNVHCSYCSQQEITHQKESCNHVENEEQTRPAICIVGRQHYVWVVLTSEADEHLVKGDEGRSEEAVTFQRVYKKQVCYDCKDRNVE